MIIEKLELCKYPFNQSYLNVFDNGFKGTAYSSENVQDYHDDLISYMSELGAYGKPLTIIGALSNAINLSKEMSVTFTSNYEYLDLHEYSYCIIKSGSDYYYYFIDEVTQENSIDKFKIHISWDAWANNFFKIKHTNNSSQYIKRRHILDSYVNAIETPYLVKKTNDYRATDEGELQRENLSLKIAEKCDTYENGYSLPKLDIAWLKIGLDRTKIKAENAFSDPVLPTQSHFSFKNFINENTNATRELEIYDHDFLKVMQGETMYLYIPISARYQGDCENTALRHNVYFKFVFPYYAEGKTVSEVILETLASANWQTVEKSDNIFSTNFDVNKFSVQDIVGGVCTDACITYNAPFNVIQQTHYDEYTQKYYYRVYAFALLYGYPQIEFLGLDGYFMHGAAAVPFPNPHFISPSYTGQTAKLHSPFYRVIESNNLIIYSDIEDEFETYNLVNFPIDGDIYFEHYKNKFLTSEDMYKLWVKKSTYPYKKISLRVGDEIYNFKPYNNNINFAILIRITGEGIEYSVSEYKYDNGEYKLNNLSPLNTATAYKAKGNLQLTSTEFTDKLVNTPISFAVDTLKPVISAGLSLISGPTVSTTFSSATNKTSHSPRNAFYQTLSKSKDEEKASLKYQKIIKDTGSEDIEKSKRKTISIREDNNVINAAERFTGSMSGIFAKDYEAHRSTQSLSSTTNTLINDRFLFMISIPLDDEISTLSIATECYYSGYEYNDIGDIHERNKKYYDYIQTDHCCLPMVTDSEDRILIENVFDRGLTIWHNDHIKPDIVTPVLIGKKNIFNIPNKLISED